MSKKSVIAHAGSLKLEHRSQPLASKAVFIRRIIATFFAAFLLTFIASFIGMAGFHYLANLSWLESFYNAAMILGGMGVVDQMRSDATILFASIYGLFSAMMFAVIIGLLFVPIAHRVYHKFHLDLSS